MNAKKGVFLIYFKKLWKLFISVKLTIIVLLSLAVTSVIGTVIPQNENPDSYFRVYGEFLYSLFDLLNLFDMYHSWWFQFLLLLLTVNIVVCSIERLSATWKIVFVRKPRLNASIFKNFSGKKEFLDNRPPEQLKKIYERFLARNYRYVKIELIESGFHFFAEKWRWTRLGVYTVHLSVILLLIGGLIGSTIGFEGYVNISEGETVSSIRLKKTGKIRHLDFEIRCDDFDVSFYDSGAPREYRSSLVVLEHGKPVFKKDIIVNSPLRYKGINIFQSSYGTLPPITISSTAEDFSSHEIALNFASRKTGKKYQKKTKIGQVLDLPEKSGKIVITTYKKSADFMGRNIGEAFRGVITPNGGNPSEILLPLKFSNFDKMRNGKMVISVANQEGAYSAGKADNDLRYYTGLQVTRDPGVWVVYSGFFVMIIGCFITFFMSHQRLCVEAHTEGEKTKIIVTGTANKNSLSMQKKIDKISRQLSGLQDKRQKRDDTP